MPQLQLKSSDFVSSLLLLFPRAAVNFDELLLNGEHKKAANKPKPKKVYERHLGDKSTIFLLNCKSERIKTVTYVTLYRSHHGDGFLTTVWKPRV